MRNELPPQLMGIVNVTPDSFSDGGRFDTLRAVIEYALCLVTEGAHILDIGGESTRPGACEISVEEEINRVIPAIESICLRTETPISIDTRKPEVAAAAIKAGAKIWNDVSALSFSENSLQTAVRLNVPVILMHAQGLPATMQQAPRYADVVEEVYTSLQNRTKALKAAGYKRPDSDIILDPGIGFGKTLEHNIALFQNLDRLTTFGHPVLLGASRKRFIAALDAGGSGAVHDRLGGSLAAALCGYTAGVTYLRVHDVAQTRQCLAVAKAITNAL